MLASKLNKSAITLGVFNVIIATFGLVILTLLSFPSCDNNGRRDEIGKFPFLTVSLAAAVRVFVMVRTGIAQEATAKMMLGSHGDSSVGDSVIRHQRRIRYKRWLWWTRFASVISVVQLLGALYLVFCVCKYISEGRNSMDCLPGVASVNYKWRQHLLILYTIIACFVAITQFFVGSDILQWRSFYATEDIAWKAHYREVFDHGMREALCCLGRVKYLSALEEDEVYSVAQLLGDLVAYRSSGTGHLELLAGLALLQRTPSSKRNEEHVHAPTEQIQDAAEFHKFSEAAYTGPLLDFGRNPVLFPCAWLYRQGVLTPWMRNRRPKLEGDNWWRGHAAAFLKYVNLSSEALRRGRVCQGKCEAAYFIVVLHHLRSVVISVRGTETPEDLITDGLCSECMLSAEDLDGLTSGSHIELNVMQSVNSTFPHYRHSGIVQTVRELYTQIEGNPDGHESNGFLSSLLGVGCECHGYSIRIVGHSLGGSIAALLGIRLRRRFPKLHVYSYGPLPCVDSVVATACSSFVTSIVYDNEFSARLSVRSILRLRAAALMSLSEDRQTDSIMILKLARRFLYLNNYQGSGDEGNDLTLDSYSLPEMAESTSFQKYGISYHNNDNSNKGFQNADQDISLWNETHKNNNALEINDDDFINPFHDAAGDVNSLDDPVSKFMETVQRREGGAAADPPEMFLPGLVIHIVPKQRSLHMSLWDKLKIHEKDIYEAYVAKRDSFQDIIVSPSMFLDHLPWRCHYAMQKVLQSRNAQGKVINDASQLV